MLSGKGSSPPQPGIPANSSASLTPLILFAASPGTITGVITLSAAHTRLGFPITALVAVAIASVVTWLVMLLVARVQRQRKRRWIRARHDHPLYGANRALDGHSVRADWTAPVPDLIASKSMTL